MYGGKNCRKSQSPEPFSGTPIVSPENAVSQTVSPVHLQASERQTQFKKPCNVLQTPKGPEVAEPVVEVGGGQSIWQPPDWAVEPELGAYYLEVVKDTKVIGQINLDKRRHIFGKQLSMCDFVLNHDSISRLHAALVTHKNGSILVIDLGSANGTFISNERIPKHNPVELKVGKSLRFDASTRTYILGENVKSSDRETTNTSLTRHDLRRVRISTISTKDLKDSFAEGNDDEQSEKSAKKIRKARVSFRDETGEELWEVIGTSDGADVETEISPAGVLSLLGEYESLVETTLFLKGKQRISSVENSIKLESVTDELQQVLNKVICAPKTGAICHQLYT